MKQVLTIAGSDSSGGAGIQADLKTFSAHGVFGMSVITAVTAQNTQGVFAVQDISKDVIAKQIEAIFDDIEVDGVKIGMVSQVPTIEVIVEQLRIYKPKTIVLDPVMVSKSGYHLLNPEAEATLIKELLPMAMVVTPNIPEAEVMTNKSIHTLKHMEEAAKAIFQMGVKNVLLKGGHLEEDSIDILFDGQEFRYYSSARIATKNTHGTGCTLSSAITANLALGHSLNQAITLAKEYITIAIQNSLPIGKGVGPTHHFYTLYKKAGLIE
ncbi:bifunctional hydroxymethylpyrimidine kinase/phosphomethylpyrimidine kinase [Desulfosporosinus sp.]|uniref:bifunctional hydroxymethylpyrimidine kinase/phosphomethylpyrimidine kinase n=1 Tax=Desulfosporosinus sp. TaxID=157907 RepID=UPI000E8B7981|nr:bifunctional hydroxymethylpyrimidine kinase/phosphomethylpyrimidine kinase [Desulfosporosinus sp.]MBC2725520.1 bifunctional hydroxymethylpyrimidine kinase/phosphomethylpyrimidine kinase [Desulfosporosinus sp.]HBV88905.1 bifunctional hydroxymethylpyrimidine kinase/phosphomethylpyrimidine kinase [Desulfosporosinus sp.]